MKPRPDPDQLLQHVQAEEQSASRGKLKLFFGASPGVGKTYAMLEAARQRKKEGIDVVLGVVETHRRKETEALVEGLEILPRKKISYKGITLDEFDLDAALVRKPGLILVDELAHSNAPGSRHSKRWQDVDELLQAGINVYTALNVQHWESLNDVVAKITGVVVQETVPDTFLETAQEVELVDLPPEELLKRLKEGKVYRGEMAVQAADNFFQLGNLIALREMALRHTAERVDAQMQAFKERHSITDVWAVHERLLVGVTGSPMSPRLVRATARLANRLRAEWIAVHVETPASQHLSENDRQRGFTTLRLAEKLGAKTVSLTGEKITDELIAYARTQNVTKIILGKPARSRWREWISGSVVNDVARQCGDIDLYVISGTPGATRWSKTVEKKKSLSWQDLLWSVAATFFSTLICWPLLHLLDRANLVMVYLVGVMTIASRFGRLPSTITAILSVLAFDFFYVPPYLTFAVSDTQYLLTFAIMLGTGLFISALTGRMRQQTQAMRRREEELRSLYQLSRELSETPDPRDLVRTAERYLHETYKTDVALLTTDREGRLEGIDPNTLGWGSDQKERSVAEWVFAHDEPAGCGTDTLAGAAGLYLPLKGRNSIVGVIGIRPIEKTLFGSPEALRQLETFASTIGSALESTKLSEAAGRAQAQAEAERMRNVVLKTLSPQEEALSRSSATGRLSEVLTEKRILRFNDAIPQESILTALIGTLDLLSPETALQAILKREEQGSTDISEGLSVPHARLPELHEIRVALGIVPAKKDVRARLIVLFFGPADEIQQHLSFLANLSKLFQQKGFRDKLLQLTNAADVLHYIRTEEETI